MMVLEHPALAALPGIRHAFLTRPALPPGLFGEGRQLTPPGVDHVLEALSWGPEVALALLTQRHTALCLRRGHEAAPGLRPVADAQVTARPLVALAVTTADCVPVLLADAQARVVGAAHAGWRGALADVVENTLAQMRALGAEAQRVVAVLGPCIAQASYEVGPELRAQVVATRPADASFFIPSARAGHAYFDLPAYVRQRLRRAGVATIAAVGHDTYADPQRFYSHRRATHVQESFVATLVAAIVLEAPSTKNSTSRS